MTETELTDRLREAIVLDGPDSWRGNGYLQQAQAAGLTLDEARKRADQISQEVANNSLLFGNIQARIARLAQPSRSHLVEQDLAQIINAARSLNLSADFVRNQWVPTELARLKKASTPLPADLPVAAAPPTPLAPTTPPDAFEDLIDDEPARPVSEPIRVGEPEPPEPVAELPITPVTAEPQPASTKPTYAPEPDRSSGSGSVSPPPVVRQFTATPARIRRGQTVMLEWNVDNLLAVTIDDLGEGLSPKNRGWIKPQKTADFTLFDANDNPLSTVRVDVIPTDRSGVYGVLFALALLALIYWFIRSGNSQPTDPKPKSRAEQSTNPPLETSAGSQRQQEPDEDLAQTETKATKPPVETPAATSEPRAEERSAKPAQQPAEGGDIPDEPVATPADARQGKYEEAFGDKPYDKIELGTDERGWRRARTNGRWGFINQEDEWVIPPDYEAVTPFRGNKAGAFLNGQLITINRAGEQVQN